MRKIGLYREPDAQDLKRMAEETNRPQNPKPAKIPKQEDAFDMQRRLTQFNSSISNFENKEKK